MMMAQQNSRAAEILQQAAGHMVDRASTYDNENGERSIPATVEAFNAITDHELTAEQGWLFMVILKLVRSQQGDYKADNYEDSSAYAALMGEQAESDRTVSGEQFGKDLLESVKQMDTMLNAGPDSVDWSKAPKNATHYCPVSMLWVDLSGGEWRFLCPNGMGLNVISQAINADMKALIPRPIDWDAAEKRMDVVGQNGNDGAAYDEIIVNYATHKLVFPNGKEIFHRLDSTGLYFWSGSRWRLSVYNSIDALRIIGEVIDI